MSLSHTEKLAALRVIKQVLGEAQEGIYDASLAMMLCGRAASYYPVAEMLEADEEQGQGSLRRFGETAMERKRELKMLKAKGL